MIDIQILMIYIVITIVTSLPLIIILVYLIISNKIHNAYHKGLTEANNENIRYYSTIKELSDSYNSIYNEIKKRDITIDLELATLLISFRKSLNKFQNI